MISLYWILWPAFLAAGLGTAFLITAVDPQQLEFAGQPVEWSNVAAYSLGFFTLWAVAAVSSLTTWFLQRDGIEINGDSIARR